MGVIGCDGFIREGGGRIAGIEHFHHTREQLLTGGSTVAAAAVKIRRFILKGDNDKAAVRQHLGGNQADQEQHTQRQCQNSFFIIPYPPLVMHRFLTNAAGYPFSQHRAGIADNIHPQTGHNGHRHGPKEKSAG